MCTIVVVDDEPIVRMDISGMLEELGFQVVGEAGDGFDAVALCRVHRPDVVLMDVKMPVFDWLTAAETITKENLADCVVLLTAFGDRNIVDQAKRAGVTGYLMKPVEQRMLLPTIEVALEQGRRLRRSQSETESARQQLEDNRLVQQAKGILARKENIEESEAYRILRQLAMDKRLPISRMARAVIDQERQRDDIIFVKTRLMDTKKLSESAAFKKIAERAQSLGCTREEAARRMRRELEEQA